MHGQQKLPPTTQKGFSLPELIIVLAILGIVIAAGMPALRGLSLSRNVRTTASDIHLSLVQVRSEAIKRNTILTLDPIITGDWASGWQMKEDTTVLESWSQISSDIVIQGPEVSLSFRPDGRLETTDDREFIVGVPGEDGIKSRCIKISLSGRPHVSVEPENGCALIE
ncbi:GspH/FimT family pseudopilin [Magnetococcales bacterium HHB-1]